MMNSDRVPSLLDIEAMRHVCDETWQGWLWYCDVHDTHGSADQEVEARVIAESHVDFHTHVDDLEPCEILIWFRSPHERV